MDTRGILESRVAWGALPLPLPQPQHLSRWWYLPDLPKVKKAAKQRAAVPPSDRILGTLCSRPLLILAWMRVFWERSGRKFLAHLPLRRKKRHLADLRDKRDKAQRVLDRLVEDADKKRRAPRSILKGSSWMML